MISTAISIDQLPGTARCWIFQSSRALNVEEESALNEHLEQFLGQWAAHGQSLVAAHEIRHHRFIIIAVDEDKAGATGCSIDAMMKKVQALNKEYQMDCLNRMKVAYRKGDEVLECSVAELQALYAEGALTDESLVYDNTVQSLGELNRSWVAPLSETWCAQMVH